MCFCPIHLSSRTKYLLTSFIPLRINSTLPQADDLICSVTESYSKYRNSVPTIACELGLIVFLLFQNSINLRQIILAIHPNTTWNTLFREREGLETIHSPWFISNLKSLCTVKVKALTLSG